MRRFLGGRPPRAACALAGLVLTGCASIGGAQKPVTSADLNRSVCPSAAEIAKFTPLVGVARRDYRDQVVLDCVKAINRRYMEFKASLQKEGVASNLATDVLSLGLASSAALTTGQASQALAGSGGFVQGVGKAVNKDVFYEQTLPAVEAAMDARRDTILRQIIDSEKSDPTATHYTLISAGFDLDAYEQAGNLYTAIAQLTQTASAAAESAKARLTESQQARVAAYQAVDLPPALAQRIRKMTDYVWTLSDPADRPVLDAIAAKMGLSPKASDGFEVVREQVIDEIVKQAGAGDAAASDVEGKLSTWIK